ncbi:MAG: preprotein translocase subunit SecY [Candidatus Dependentiae bacterium]|nr:preprotein translocase subunit SecY [Candidatus Dependentiae bacterium]
MVLLKSFRNIFVISELRKKIFFVLGVLIINRLGTYIPVIGVNVPMLSDLMQQKSGIGGFLGYFDIFSGGALSRCTVFALGIQPYITASIFMQILGMTIPSFEQLMKEGEYGRKIINQYTRYLALILSVAYSFSYAMLLESKGIVLVPGWGFRITFVLTLTAGAMLVMWMGDQISLHGIGNGSSVLIFAGIISSYPAHALKLMAMVEQGHTHILMALAVLLAYLIITAGIVFLEKADRKIPVHYARRVVGNRVYGGQSTYIPFKINSAGIMPVIFASTVIRFPLIIAGMLSSYFPSLQMVVQSFYNGPLLTVVDFLLVIMFSFFYTALFVNPTELAENIRKGGGFVPGLRPGKQTADYFNYTLTRVGLVGAIYLATLAILPTLLQNVLHIPFEESGTGMLIVIGVALEVSNQIESYLIERRYEGFLRNGRLKGRAVRS